MTTPSGRILTVGAGQQYSSLNAALAASQDGDTIAVAAGTYTNDISTVTHAVTIEGVGGLAHFQSTGLIANGKAILIDDASSLTIENLEFSGAQVSDGNGAGIRWESGDLVIKNSYFHDNQDGILGSSTIAGANATIDGSTFTHNGAGDGQTHGVYMGHINALTVTNSFFQDQIGGSDVKSRAATNLISHNSFIDTDAIANGTNYQVDLPEGGNDTVSNNTVLKSATANNWAVVHFGGEIANPVGSLLVQNNSLYSESGAVVVTDQTTGQPVQVQNNSIDTTHFSPIIYSPTGTPTNTTVSGTSSVSLSQAPATTLVVPTALDTGVTLSGGSATTTSGSSGTTTISTPATGHVLTVGAGQQYSSLAAAIAASQDGDTIALAPGTYTNDYSTITHSVTIEGVGGLAHLVSTGLIPNGKAILIDDAANLTIENLEFSGAAVADSNGAGIRYETGNLVIKNSYFHDNQEGILGNSYNTAGNVTIDGSTFTHNGAGDGQTHGIYIGHNQSLTVTNSFFQDQLGGSDVKSRAAVNLVSNNQFIDTDSSSDETNYQVDLPEGGNDTISGNLVLKSTYPNNFAIIHFGGEIANPIGSLLVENNNFFSGRNPSVVVNDQTTGQPIQVLNNGIDTTDIQTIVYSPTETPANVTVSGSTPLNIFTQAPPTTLVVPTPLDTGITLSGSGSGGTGGNGGGSSPPPPPPPPTNAPPVTSVPASQTVVDGSTLALAGISVADADGSTETFTVTLAAVDGTVSTSGGAGTITGNGSAAVTLTGSLANVNSDLASLGFTGTAVGAGNLAIATSDGNGGSDSHSIAISVTAPLPINAPPVTSVPASQTVVDGSTLALAGISIADADGSTETFTVTLAAVDGTVSTSGGAGTITGNGTAALTLSGSLANVNADLAALGFKGTAIGAGSLAINTNDGNGGSDSHSIAIGVTDAPPVTSVPGPQSVMTGAKLALSGIGIADADGATQSFTVTLAGVDGTVSTSGGAGTITGNGTGHVTLTGSLANMNSDLASLSFTAGSTVGGGSLQITTSDGMGGSDNHTIAINVTAPPSHTLTVGAGQQYSSLSAALAASHDGDTIMLQAGTYTTGAVTATHAVTIEGVNGMAHLVANGPVANGGALLTTSNNVTLENLEISGVSSKNHSAVAIRAAAGNLTMSGMSVHDNDSALADSVAGSTLTVSNSDFGHNGGGKAAALAVGTIADFELSGSTVHDSVGVTQVQSTALTTNIAHDQVLDGSGSALYALNLPNVGNVVVSYSSFSRGAGALNASLINLGGGVSNPAGFLTVHDTTFVSTGNGTHVLNNHTAYNSIGFQNDGIGHNLTQPFIGQPPATQGDYLI